MSSNKFTYGTTLNSEQLGHEYRDMLKDRHANPEQWRGLEFGHPDLDRITGGARRKEFIVMAGAQKAGKTTVALAWTIHFAKQLATKGEKILFVSLEMSHESIAGRVLSNLADIDVTRFRDYQLQELDWSKLDRGVDELDTLGVLWNVGAYTMDGIEQIVKTITGIRLLVVDYFQLMQSDISRDSKRWEQLEDLSRRLKQLAMSYNITVLAISQQSREALRSADKQKDPNTLAGTQALARDCDLLLLILPFMEKGEEVPHMRKMHIALSRNSAMDITLDACFFGQHCKFGAPIKEGFAHVPAKKETGNYWWEL